MKEKQIVKIIAHTLGCNNKVGDVGFITDINKFNIEARVFTSTGEELNCWSKFEHLELMPLQIGTKVSVDDLNRLKFVYHNVYKKWVPNMSFVDDRIIEDVRIIDNKLCVLISNTMNVWVDYRELCGIVKVDYNNTVIEVLTKEHGKKVIEWWKEQGVNTCNFNGSNNKEDGGIFNYYGLLNGVFDNRSINLVKEHNLKIITLPETKTTTMNNPVTQPISRTALKSLYDDIACDSWKVVIKQFLREQDIFDEILLVPQELIDKAFGEANESKKVFLRKYFKEKKEFNASMLKVGEMMKVTDTRNSYEGETLLRTYNCVISLTHLSHVWDVDCKLIGDKLPTGTNVEVISK
jgi:hypothetical protein